MPNPQRTPRTLRLTPLEDRTVPALFVGLAAADGLTLVGYDSDAPGTVLNKVTVSGLDAGASLVGIDYRGSNGKLYGVASNSRLYTIDPASGAATAVGGTFTTALNGTVFGVDVNPAADKLRIVSNTNQNLRVNLDTGDVAATDPAQTYDAARFNAAVADGTPPAPVLVATAYTRNPPVSGTTAPVTTQYVIDGSLNLLSTQGTSSDNTGTDLVSPNTGILFAVDKFTFTAGTTVGFDIQDGTDLALVAVGNKLYSVNLGTAGTVTVGNLPTAANFKDLAFLPPATGAGTVAFAVTTATFNADTRGPLALTVTRTGGSAAAATIDYSTGGGTAVAGTDYLPATGTLTFAAGETTRQIVLLLPGGPASPAPARTFNVTLSNPTGGATLGANAVTAVTIPAVTTPAFGGTFGLTTDVLSFADNRGPLTVTVTRSGGLTETATVNFSTVNGTATSGTDFQPATGTLTFGPNETSKTITLNLPAGTPTPGSARTFTLVLSNPSANAAIAEFSQATVTIPAVVAPDASVVSLSAPAFTFNADRSALVVTVTRSGNLAGSATVNFATAGSTTATSGTDFLPATGTLTFGPNEASKTITLALPQATAAAPARTFTLTLSAPGGNAVLGANSTATITIPAVTAGGGGVPPGQTGANGQPLVVRGRASVLGTPQFSVGGPNGAVTVLNPDRSTAITATGLTGFTGAVRSATADFTGDGIADVAVGTGPRVASQVAIIDGATGKTVFTTAPFESSFTGGVFVATGDLNGDGTPDLIITPDQGGGPRVRIFSGAAGNPQLADFFGIEDANFRGGARAAAGDLNGDGRADLVVAAGFGGGPRVAVFNGTTVSLPLAAGALPPKLYGDFFVYEEGLRNGAFVAVGDVTGDGFGDLFTGAGPGGGPRVSVFDGRSLLGGNTVTRAFNFFAGDPNNREGVRVAVKDLDNDNLGDLVTAAGSTRIVTAYAGKALPAAAPGTAPGSLFTYDAGNAALGGVFVG